MLQPTETVVAIRANLNLLKCPFLFFNQIDLFHRSITWHISHNNKANLFSKPYCAHISTLFKKVDFIINSK